MAKLKLVGKVFYSDVTIKGKRIREPLSIYRPIAERKLGEMLELARMQRRGQIPENLSWDLFKEKYREFTISQDYNSRNFRDLAFKAIDDLLAVQALREITPERLVELKAKMIKNKYAPSMVIRLCRQVKTIMCYAENMKYVPMQNWRIVKLVESAGRLDFYTFEAYYELLEKLKGTPWFTPAYIMGRAGLRLSEMHFLEWSDVQFSFRRFYLRSKDHLEWRIKSDQVGNKFRIIPLTLEHNLESHLKSIPVQQGFVLGADRLSSAECYGRQLASALEATGVKTYLGEYGTAHTLRHTFGSHLAQKGVSLKKIGEWMGHATTRMTEVYAHLIPGNPDEFSFKPSVDFLSTFQTSTVIDSHLQQNNAQFGIAEISSKTGENGLKDAKITNLGR